MCIEIGISVQRRAIQKLRIPKNENSFAVIMDLGIMKVVVQAGLVGECCGPILIPFACTNIHSIIMRLSSYQVCSFLKTNWYLTSLFISNTPS